MTSEQIELAGGNLGPRDDFDARPVAVGHISHHAVLHLRFKNPRY